MFSRLLRIPKAMVRQALSWLTSSQAAIPLGEHFFHLKGMRRKDRWVNFSKVKSVLIIRLDEIGDVVFEHIFFARA